jgi:hypothetical protein
MGRGVRKGQECDIVKTWVRDLGLLDERLRTKTEGCTQFGYTGLVGGLEHLKIETRLKDERFET